MKHLQVRNRQRAVTIRADFVRSVASYLLDDLLRLSAYELGVHLVSPRRMSAINWQFLQHAGSTDVISFDYNEGYEGVAGSGLALAGELFISPSDAISQAQEFNTTPEQEIIRYLVHGVLHLRGYDDLTPAKRKVMKREENRLVRQLARKFDFQDVSR